MAESQTAPLPFETHQDVINSSFRKDYQNAATVEPAGESTLQFPTGDIFASAPTGQVTNDSPTLLPTTDKIEHPPFTEPVSGPKNDQLTTEIIDIRREFDRIKSRLDALTQPPALPDPITTPIDHDLRPFVTDGVHFPVDDLLPSIDGLDMRIGRHKGSAIGVLTPFYQALCGQNVQVNAPMTSGPHSRESGYRINLSGVPRTWEELTEAGIPLAQDMSDDELSDFAEGLRRGRNGPAKIDELTMDPELLYLASLPWREGPIGAPRKDFNNRLAQIGMEKMLTAHPEVKRALAEAERALIARDLVLSAVLDGVTSPLKAHLADLMAMHQVRPYNGQFHTANIQSELKALGIDLGWGRHPADTDFRQVVDRRNFDGDDPVAAVERWRRIARAMMVDTLGQGDTIEVIHPGTDRHTNAMRLLIPLKPVSPDDVIAQVVRSCDDGIDPAVPPGFVTIRPVLGNAVPELALFASGKGRDRWSADPNKLLQIHQPVGGGIRDWISHQVEKMRKEYDRPIVGRDRNSHPTTEPFGQQHPMSPVEHTHTTPAAPVRPAKTPRHDIADILTPVAPPPRQPTPQTAHTERLVPWKFPTPDRRWVEIMPRPGETQEEICRRGRLTAAHGYTAAVQQIFPNLDISVGWVTPRVEEKLLAMGLNSDDATVQAAEIVAEALGRAAATASVHTWLTPKDQHNKANDEFYRQLEERGYKLF